jgi:hypothetical protein
LGVDDVAERWPRRPREDGTDFIEGDARNNLVTQGITEWAETSCGCEDLACCGGWRCFIGFERGFQERTAQYFWCLAEPVRLHCGGRSIVIVLITISFLRLM